MFTRISLAAAIALLATAMAVAGVAAQSRQIDLSGVASGHGLWLPISLIVVLTLLSVPAMGPAGKRKLRR